MALPQQGPCPPHVSEGGGEVRIQYIAVRRRTGQPLPKRPQTGFTSRSLSPLEQDHVQRKQDCSEIVFTGLPEGNHLNKKEKMETAPMGMCKLVPGNGEQWPVTSPTALP